MSELVQRELFLTVGEQQVLLVLEAMLGEGPRPTKGDAFLTEVQKELRRRKLKPLKPTRIGQIIAALEKKGYLFRSIVLLKRRQAVA